MDMKAIKLFIAICILLCFPAIGMAADYYVTQDGGDADCSGSPCSAATFNTIFGDYSDDTFYFSGTFTTRIVVTAIYGTSGHPVILDGYEAGNTAPLTDVWAASNGALLSYGMSIGNQTAGPDYITIQDFRMTNQYDSTPGLNISALIAGTDDTSHCDYLTIQRNYVRETNGTMFYYYSGRYSIIENNKFIHFGQNGTDATQGVNLIETDNLIARNNEMGHDEANYSSGCLSANTVEVHGSHYQLWEYNNIYGAPNQAGITFKEGFNGNSYIVLRFNKLHNNNGNGLGVGGDASSPNSYVYIYGNFIYSNGFDFYGGGAVSGSKAIENDYYADHIQIWSNILVNNAYAAYGAYQNTGGYLNIINNTIAYNGDRGVDPNQIARGGLNPSSGTNMVIKNNLFWYNRPLATTFGKWNQLYLGNDPTMDHNGYWHPDSDNDATVDFWYYSGAYYNLTEIKAAGKETNGSGSIQDPGFLNPDGADVTYGTVDDDYTLTSVGSLGEDLSGTIATVTVQGVDYVMDYKWAP